ncbi:unnamed protein product [Callosobruchus maculatus]|uniref:Uncharacterized protein n=1 Tax=Callosobruchus maculatus TaxID=64391 RepID=A0A653CW15_CALMS|nr:unnamed protein product [Callosobruchus maculatus]
MGKRRRSVSRDRRPKKSKRLIQILENVEERLANLEKESRRRCRTLDSSSSNESRSPTASSGAPSPSSSMLEPPEQDTGFVERSDDLPQDVTPQAHCSTQATPTPASVHAPLSEDIVDILGRREPDDQQWGPPLHSDVVLRWEPILKSGLSETDAKALIHKHLPPENFKAMSAPRLNLVIERAVSNSHLLRDQKLSALQQQIAASLAAMSQLITAMLTDGGGGNRQYISLINDASRLLLNVLHEQTVARRGLLAINLSKDFQNVNQNIPLDSFLFGENLEERLKLSKDLEASGKILKAKEQKAPKAPGYAPPLNSRAPPRQQGNRRERSRFYHTIPTPRKQPTYSSRQPRRGTTRRTQ